MTLSDDELRDEVLVVPRRAFAVLPDSRVIDRPDWVQVITPSLRAGGSNEVTHAVLADDEADAVIDRVCAEYAALGVQWRWAVGPDSRPTDLGERLARRGLLYHEVAGLAGATAGAVRVPGVEVERVDERTIAELTDVIARGWEIDPAPLLPAYRAALAAPGHRLYLARIGGEAVGAAKAVWFERSIYLQAGVVVHAHRGRGAYRALVAARLADAAAAGIALAVSHARPETSGPILERMGFRDVVRFASYASPR